jgi:hypothetical protein
LENVIEVRGQITSVHNWEVKMKKILVSLVTASTLLSLASSANAHGWRGGYGGGWHHGGGWVPFAVGAVAGAVVVNSYYRPAPVYYGPGPAYYDQPNYYYPQQHARAYCPENGLYYPQTQACPSGWQRVVY